MPTMLGVLCAGVPAAFVERGSIGDQWGADLPAGQLHAGHRLTCLKLPLVAAAADVSVPGC